MTDQADLQRARLISEQAINEILRAITPALDSDTETYRQAIGDLLDINQRLINENVELKLDVDRARAEAARLSALIDRLDYQGSAT